ncbi:CvfB family protein [Thalassotalea eurytherma]|uniref:GntR family transcriptional regulator n=1 Tax=Thalassotalea eurytherma TaxID=1144278 RepID=A0ABQ6H8M6_9GAMM|nr:S1-like domain-containing RNA-binding protein [Thalassotalea eurytherma]GLX83110.1 GntR family transcriptional regulator [Thalassotalea eurytherma]
MAQIGAFNQLTVIDIIAHGAVLDGGDKGEILLPNRYVPEQCQAGDVVDVFIYADSQDRLVATTQKPKAQSGEFASLKVVQSNKIGAFLDWGLPKDLLVPFNHQHRPMEVGKFYLVRVLNDERTERIVASSKLDRFLDVWPAEYEQGEAVDLIIAGKTDLGFKAIVNNQHWGLIFQSDIFKPLRTGQKMKGYIKQMREDGRIDLMLSRAGKGKVIDFKDQLIDYLNQHDGFCDIHDKSSPALIQKTFGVSKKAFKATVGHLLKQGKITIEANGIRLN